MLDQMVYEGPVSGQPRVVIDRDQIRMARVGLEWSQEDLARESHLGVATIRRAEAGKQVSAGNMFLIQHAFQEAGIVFLEDNQASPGGGRGLRLRSRP